MCVVAGVVDARVLTLVLATTQLHCQARQFGSSPYLQTSDYHREADMPFATSYKLTSSTMSIPLLPKAVGHLSKQGKNQFRITMELGSFSNYNGAMLVPSCCSVCVVGV